MDVVACTPHPGLGTISIRRGARVEVVNLATCARHTRTVRGGGAVTLPSGVRVRVGKHAQSIVVHGKTIYTVHEDYRSVPAGDPGPIEILGASPNARWLLFAIDPEGSASLAADGLALEAIPAEGGQPRQLGMNLGFPSYHVWCGSRLYLTQGSDRVAWNNKELAYADPPYRTVVPIFHRPYVAWSSIACDGDRGRQIVVSQQSTELPRAHWALWRARSDGHETQLTHPPRYAADEAPAVSRDGRTILFVRTLAGHGTLYALRGGTLVGPLLSVGYRPAFFGHTEWGRYLTWSLQR